MRRRHALVAGDARVRNARAWLPEVHASLCATAGGHCFSYHPTGNAGRISEPRDLSWDLCGTVWPPCVDPRSVRRWCGVGAGQASGRRRRMRICADATDACGATPQRKACQSKTRQCMAGRECAKVAAGTLRRGRRRVARLSAVRQNPRPPEVQQLHAAGAHGCQSPGHPKGSSTASPISLCGAAGRTAEAARHHVCIGRERQAQGSQSPCAASVIQQAPRYTRINQHITKHVGTWGTLLKRASRLEASRPRVSVTLLARRTSSGGVVANSGESRSLLYHKRALPVSAPPAAARKHHRRPNASFALRHRAYLRAARGMPRRERARIRSQFKSYIQQRQ